MYVSHEVALAPSDYQNMTTTPPELVADILTGAQLAYDAAVIVPGGRAGNLTASQVPRSPSCLFVANRVTDHLNQLGKGYDANVDNAYFPDLNQDDDSGIFHLITKIQAPDLTDETIVADATWQQFLKFRSMRYRLRDAVTGKEHLPVFIGTSTEIARVALGVGFSKRQSQTWR